MKNEFNNFKTEMDSWVKTLSSQINSFRDVPSLVEENVENIDHNYELLLEMQSEMKKLKEEVSALRMIQLMHLNHDVKVMKSSQKIKN